MKRIAQALLAISLATTGVAALAASTSYPSSIGEEGLPLSSVFPGMPTYADSHRNDVASQPAMAFPSSGRDQYPLSLIFPDIETYGDLHRNDPVVVSNTPTFPASADDTTTLVERGLYPELEGGPSGYAGVAHPTRN